MTAARFAELLAEHYADPYHRGECERTTHAGEAECDATGCQLRIELATDDDGHVLEAWFDGEGCEVCEGLASILVQWLEAESGEPTTALAGLDIGATSVDRGEPGDDANAKPARRLAAAGWGDLRRQVETMLAAADDPHARDRLACCELVFETLEQALQTPLDAIDGDLPDGTGLGGPSLREEC